MTDFIGREAELASLAAVTRLDSASLIVIKGRRRVGKSRVATELATRLTDYQSVLLEGMAPSSEVTAADEREDFAAQLSHKLSIPPPRAEDWNTLLWALAEHAREGRWIIILDEINWIGAKDPTFLPKLKSAWDQYFSANRRLIMILSGSLTGWIQRNILHSTAFVGRVHLDLTLDELPLRYCATFFKRGHSYLSSYEKLRMLSVTGGIPAYLERIDPATSADANITRLCFKKDGYLFKEFEILFQDLFERKQFYRRLIEAVAERPLDLQGIYHKLKVEKSSYVSGCVDELVQTGFLARHYNWNIKTGHESKRSVIRIIDNYTRFYFRCIKPSRAAIERGTARLPPGIDGVLGLQLENLILKNRAALWERLGLDIADITFENPYWQSATNKTLGCQIDYMVQCRNNTIYVCEVKLAKHPLPQTVIADVAGKIDRLVKPRNYTFRPVLIHVNGVEDAVMDARYFDHVIDFGELLS